MAAPDERRLAIEVAHGGEDEVIVIPLRVSKDTTVAEAIRQSGVLERFPSIDPAQNKVGIYGRIVSPDTFVKEGDRIEIYRPLKADPKEVRRRRASAQKRGGGKH